MTFPNSVTNIGSYAFSYCSGLTSIEIPNSVTNIGNGVFWNCSGLTSIEIPNSVTSILGNPFLGCTSLTDIIVEKGNPIYDSRENSNAIIETETNTLISGCMSTVIPNSVTAIGSSAFYGCTELKYINIPSSVMQIEKGAFGRGCGVTSIKMNSVNTPELSGDIFQGNQVNTMVYIPYRSKAKYESAEFWNNMKTVIGYTEYIDYDVNIDGDVDVVDVVDVARFVVGRPSDSFVEILADVNIDGTVNLGDAVVLVNEITGNQEFTRSKLAPSSMEMDEMLTLSTTDGEGISLCMDNVRSYTAFQFDLYVPNDVAVTGMSLNPQRKNGHQFMYNKLEAGHYRVAALSTSNQAFDGNTGNLITIRTDGVLGKNVTISNIRFFDASGNGYEFDDIDTITGIGTTNYSTEGNAVGIYDIQGRRHMTLHRGINIFNGRKVLVK